MKLPRLLLILAVSVLSALGIAAQSTNSAQSRATTKAEIEKRLEEATLKSRNRAYREKESFYEYLGSDPNKPNYYSIITTEYQSPNDGRGLLETGGQRQLEIIQIGKTCFTSYDSSSWSVDSDCGQNTARTLIGRMPDLPGAVEKHEFLGEVMNNGIRADLFRTTRLSVGKGQAGDKDHLMVDSYWFDKNGLLVKQQNIWTWTKGKKFEGRREKTFEYEYDLKFKIEAPIK